MRKPVLAVFSLVLVAAIALGLSACGGSGKEGGTLTGSYASFPEALDPALSYSQEAWTAMYDTYLPLLTYKRANGEQGSQVVPGLAETMPKLSNGGKTYELTLRQGLKYSDGTPVKASDFKSSIERLFLVNSPGSPFFETIVGAKKFAETKKGGITGIKADDKTGRITIDLTAPRSTFTNELGLLPSALLPSSTPARNLTDDPPPATGPYEIVDVKPKRSWSYRRNPYWATDNGPRIDAVGDGHFDKIEISVVRNDSTQVNEIEQNKTMWMQPPPPADRYAEVKDRYEGTQLRIEHPINVYYFWMNTRKPPFDDVEVRQAVNYAVDPAALERIYAGSLAATHQILPEGMPGHKAFDLYPHSMAKAKQLFTEANPSDREITVWTNNENPNDEAGAYFQDVLSKLGFDAKLKTINADNYFGIIGNESTPDLDAGWGNWYEDYPHPNDFFELPLSGNSIAPTNSYNFARADIPALTKKIARLATEPLGSKQEAEYAELDKAYMEEAVWAPYGTSTTTTFVNDEIDLDKVVFNPTLGQSLASFQLK